MQRGHLSALAVAALVLGIVPGVAAAADLAPDGRGGGLQTRPMHEVQQAELALLPPSRAARADALRELSVQPEGSRLVARFLRAEDGRWWTITDEWQRRADGGLWLAARRSAPADPPPADAPAVDPKR